MIGQQHRIRYRLELITRGPCMRNEEVKPSEAKQKNIPHSVCEQSFRCGEHRTIIELFIDGLLNLDLLRRSRHRSACTGTNLFRAGFRIEVLVRDVTSIRNTIAAREETRPASRVAREMLRDQRTTRRRTDLERVL